MLLIATQVAAGEPAQHHLALELAQKLKQDPSNTELQNKIAALGDTATPALLKLLGHFETDTVRETATGLLRKIGEPCLRDVLRRYRETKSPETHAALANVVQSIGEKSAPAILEIFFGDLRREWSDNISGWNLMKDLGAPVYIRELLRIEADPKTSVEQRVAALTALSEWGGEPDVAQALNNALKSFDDSIRSAAQRSLDHYRIQQKLKERSRRDNTG